MLLIGLAHAAPPNELRRGNGPEPATLNPLLAQDISAHNVLRDLFEGLVTESPTGAIEPGQAQSWVLSDDGLTMRFTLREGQWRCAACGRLCRQLETRVRPATSRALCPSAGDD
jgi:ABC-type oligopeptide transport system substrate-binding subunit